MFRKKKKEDSKKKLLDKVLMGAVIGGAIGSVVGATIAPQKGQETRKEIVDAAKNAKKVSGKLYKKFRQFIKKKKNNAQKEIPYE